MLHLLTLVLLVLSSFSYVINAKKDFYRAAVLELAQITNISYPAPDKLRKHLEIYDIAAKTAAKKEADIIVFPESGLLPFKKPSREWLLNFIEDIPDPKKAIVNPCEEASQFNNLPILRKLSCLARDNNIYVVANTADFKKCDINSNCNRNKNSKNCTSCPDDGHFFYNTNVVFDRDGTLVAKYYKRHLYFEAEMNTPDFPENAYFDTEFGKFTTVICFDLIFKDSVKALEEPSVLNVAYPTYWFDHTPLIFFAPPFQQAWSMANKVNLLAANTHHPPTGSLGSGIYSPNRGALIYTFNPDGRSKLLISNVPTMQDGLIHAYDLRPRRFLIENGQAIPEEGEEEPVFQKECLTTILKEDENSTDYRCDPTSVDRYQFKKLKKNEGEIEICDNDFCCSLSYQAESMNEDYFFGVTGKDMSFYNVFKFGTQSCFLARCESIEGKACTNYILKSNTVFRRVEIKGNFLNDQILPFAIDSDVRLTNKNKWSFDQKSRMMYSNFNKQSSLLFFGLHGRLFDRDKNIYDESNSAPYYSSIGPLLTLGLSLSFILVTL
ncbi:vascular non-inflammatory molecule 2 [Nephila pilipes]|uniref:Vascular non-inflammatory molecule 2 n=1 Tax=Nephila pilipes TaxID=299642 RepID=A0A8X6NIZ7_NEPPI|nr:vascular non-inflammatory molecule 2 [Nephila pilipes]